DLGRNFWGWDEISRRTALMPALPKDRRGPALFAAVVITPRMQITFESLLVSQRQLPRRGRVAAKCIVDRFGCKQSRLQRFVNPLRRERIERECGIARRQPVLAGAAFQDFAPGGDQAQ